MNSVKKNFIYNSLYQVLVIFIPLITTPYVSRVLGANGVGTYSYYYSISRYFGLFIMLGLNNYGNRSIAQCRENKKELSRTFWSIYAMQFVTGVVVCLIYLFYFILAKEDKLIIAIMGIYVISNIFDINWLFFGLEKFRLTVIRNAIVKISTTCSIFFFVKSKNDVWVYCLILVLGMLISQIVLWPIVLKNIERCKISFADVKIHIKPNLTLFLTVLAISLYKTMDKIMLGVLSNKEEVGFYESSEKIVGIPIALIESLGTVMLPRMSNIVVNKGRNANDLIYKSMIFAIFLASSMAFGIMGLAREFVPWFYGNGYEICIDLFMILLPSCLFLGFANVIRTQYLLPNKKDKIFIVSTFIGAFVNLFLNYLLIPCYASIGAAIGTLVAEASVCIYQAVMVAREIEIRKYVTKGIPLVISGIIMFLCLNNFGFNDLNFYLRFFVKIIIGIALYFMCMAIFEVLYYKMKKHSFFGINYK